MVLLFVSTNRFKLTNILEKGYFLANMPPKTGRIIVDKENSFMFEKTKKKVFNHEDTGRKNAEDCEDVVQVKDLLASQVRKMKSEMHMHTFKERKDAARLTKSEMRCTTEAAPGIVHLGLLFS